jgi:hypothetical protein
MFGLGKVDGLKRREWNSRVKHLLENRIGIETDHIKNPNFPAILAFGQLLDMGWFQKVCPEDNALFISLAYWHGCAKNGALEEARRINDTILDYLAEVGASGKVPVERGRQFVMFYDNHRWLLGGNSG